MSKPNQLGSLLGKRAEQQNAAREDLPQLLAKAERLGFSAQERDQLLSRYGQIFDHQIK
nr:hypothetical protein [uncultured Cohaesibacter sp.]